MVLTIDHDKPAMQSGSVDTDMYELIASARPRSLYLVSAESLLARYR
jgi:hypothetical protein